MDTLVALHVWAKQWGIALKSAQNMAKRGELPMLKVDNGHGKMMEKIDLHYQPNLGDKVVCAICDKAFSQITAPHLRSHGTTIAEYRNKFPDSPLVSDAAKDANSRHKIGKPLSEAHKQAVALSKIGTVQSPEARMKNSESRKAAWKRIRGD